MGLFNMFSSIRKFQPTNALEIMLSRHEHLADPRRFYELLMTRQLFILVKDKPDVSGEIIFQPGHEINFIVNGIEKLYAYVFTSLEALEYSTKKRKFDGGFIRLEGRSLVDILLDAQLGMYINNDHDDTAYADLDNLKYVLTELKPGT